MQKSYKMGILYEDEKDIKISVEIKQKDGVIQFDFTSNCGKFGADEGLAEYELTVNQLLKILVTTDVGNRERSCETCKYYPPIGLNKEPCNDCIEFDEWQQTDC